MPRPSSFSVGTLGKRGERLSPHTDSRRRRPCSTYGAHAGVSATDITWPPSSACIDSELPLNGMCENWTFCFIASSSIVRCSVVIEPGVP